MIGACYCKTSFFFVSISLASASLICEVNIIMFHVINKSWGNIHSRSVEARKFAMDFWRDFWYYDGKKFLLEQLYTWNFFSFFSSIKITIPN